MEIQYHNEKIPYYLVEDFYTEREENLIKQELDFLLPSLKGPEGTMSATKQGETLKQNTGIFVDTVYTDRSYSQILTLNRKLFSLLEEQKESLTNKDWFFKNQQTTGDYTLVSYYEQSDYYKSHSDNALYTSLCWFYREPKSFSGGNLTFTDFDISIECKNNRMIVFPSMINHEVSEVRMDEEKVGQGLGRWCLTQFALAK